MEVTVIDKKTVMVKSDDEKELAELIDYIAHKKENDAVDALLKAAAKRKTAEKAPVYNRDGYDRSWLPD